ncbi:MAG TPA: hypothetical protein VIQ98_08790 [Gemmatimonadales bacterium]
MTFLHKLAKRLALIGATPALLGALLASCSEGTTSEYLGPDPHQPGSTTTYIGLSIYPNDPQLALGDSIKLQARGWLPSGLSTPAAVTWSGNGATVSSDGWFRATSLGVFRIQASALASAGLLDDILITVSTSGGIARLDVTPNAPSLPAGTSQQFTAVALMKNGTRSTPGSVTWTAEGGEIDQNGVFKAHGSPGGYKVKAKVDSTVEGETGGVVSPAVLTQLHLDPPSMALERNEVLVFGTTATWSDGSHTVPPLTYSATGGSITSAGVYTAGGTPGQFQVIVSGGGMADTASVTIMTSVVGLRLAPLTAVLALGATQQLQAYAERSDGTETLASVQWTAQGGTITAGGSYTAGTVAGNYPIIGALPTSSGQVFRDTAHFQVGASAASLTTLAIRSDTSLKVGSTAQFTVVGSWSDGSSTVPSVTWSATAGTINTNGLYTAPSAPGTQKIFAKDKNSPKADTAVVQVTEQEGQLTAFTIAPATTILSIEQTRQFSATLSWSDGKVHPVDISWVSAGGTITQNGFYTAGRLAGTFLIVATCSCGAADTASVSVTAPTAAPVTLTQLSLTPSTTQVAPGGSKQFSVTGVWSDGGTATPAATYIAEGGTISSAGLFVAASTPGLYKVIATQAGGGPADTAMVTVGTVTLTLIDLSLSPGGVSLAPGEAVQMSAVGGWSDGSTTSPPVSWTATGGTISTTGLYTAGGATGTFQISALHAATGRTATATVNIGTAVPQGGGSAALPQAPRALVDVTYPAVTGKTISVASGGNLQTAINSAACGDEIVLAAGAVFTGNFILPNKNCTKYIVIRSAGACPSIGTRVTPATSAGFARLMAPGSNLSPVEAKDGAGYYRLACLEITAPSSVTSLNTLVRLSHTGATSVSQLPHHIVLDRLWIHGHATMNLTRCLIMNTATSAVVDSYLDDCHTAGSDSQAIVAYNGTGPYLIENNYLAGAGENVMFGGSDPTIQGLIPSDIVFRRNHVHKPASWKGVWTSKNLLELKNAQRLLIEGNVFENNWIDGQAGHAFNFKSTNQSGTAPWSVTRDVNFQHNVIWKSACGMKVSSAEHVAGTAGLTERIRIAHNMFSDIGGTYGGCGTIFQLQYDVADLTVEYNTGWAPSSAIVFYGLPALQRVTIQGNILGRGAFGFKGDNTGEGTKTLATYAPGGLVVGNLILGAVASSYPSGNSFPSSQTAAGLASADGVVWALQPTSAYLAAGPNGTRPGPDIQRLQTLIAGVTP